MLHCELSKTRSSDINGTTGQKYMPRNFPRVKAEKRGRKFSVIKSKHHVSAMNVFYSFVF